MKICILVLTNINKADGASRIRPLKLIDSFKKYHPNLEIYYLRERRHKPLKVVSKLIINNEKIDLCYIESQTFPLSFREKLLIAILKLKGTKIFYFYRDMYWKFNIGRNSMSIFRWKKHYLKQLISLKFLEIFIDKLYVPTKTLIKYFPLKMQNNISDLPPAGDINNINYNPNDRSGALYVGGLSIRYGLKLMLEAFSKINDNETIPLTIICRKDDYQNNKNYIKNYLSEDWLIIKHLNNQELRPELLKHKIGILPLEISDYNSLALPYKIFEYSSYGLPVFSSNNSESIKLINKHNIGINIGGNADEFYETIIKYYHDHNKLSLMSESCFKFINEEATWEHRHKKIINDYSKL